MTCSRRFLNTPFNVEKEVGIECYLTETAGIGGKIKVRPKDFVVREMYDLEFCGSGKYAVIEVEKTRWDTHKLIKELSRRLGIGKNRIGYSGTKDKDAVSTQKMSIWGVKRDDLERINIKDVSIRFLGYSNKNIHLGDHYGNYFDVTIRDVPSIGKAVDRVDDTIREAKEKGGFPNFFGMQRFGSLRPITHKVGERIVKRDFKGAVLTYLSYTSKYESEETREARECAKEEDFKKALKIFPKHLRYELAILNHLVKCPKDYIGALKSIQLGVRTLFVHAYQSYIFNEILSERIRRGLFYQCMDGDYISFRGNKNIERSDRKRIKLYESLIEKRRAFITAPLIGYESELSDLELEVSDSFEIDRETFKIEEFPELSSKGIRRPISICSKIEDFRKQTEISCKIVEDGLNLKFPLLKGSYATSLLREVMKEDPVKANF